MGLTATYFGPITAAQRQHHCPHWTMTLYRVGLISSAVRVDHESIDCHDPWGPE